MIVALYVSVVCNAFLILSVGVFLSLYKKSKKIIDSFLNPNIFGVIDLLDVEGTYYPTISLSSGASLEKTDTGTILVFKMGEIIATEDSEINN